MRIQTQACAVVLSLLVAAAACSQNPDPETQPETAAGASDTTTQNPPGYRGMERDTTMVPEGAGQADSNQRVYDTLDTMHDDSASVGQGQGGQAGDTTGGYQNPPGYRGMERDTSSFPVRENEQQGGAGDTTGVSGQAQDQGQYQQNQGQDTTGYGGQQQDTSGYGGQQQDTSGAGQDTSGFGGQQGDTSSTSGSSTSTTRDSI